jgi:hypothetical protein
VSGGSILAAHLALNWELYNGDEKKFARVSERLLDFVRADVRGRIFRRYLLTWSSPIGWLAKLAWTRTSSLARHYDKLFEGAELRDLARSRDGLTPPSVSLLTTSMTTGGLCAFSASGFAWVTENDRLEQIDVGTVPVSLAVAASSAFPVFFPPVKVTHDTLKCSKRAFPNPYYLTDGGVYDNLGLSFIRLLERGGSGVRFESVVVSDAEGLFDWETQSAFGLLAGPVRASELLMKRVSELEYANVPRSWRDSGKFLQCRIREVVNYDIDKGFQRAIAGVRTDLDRFAGNEIAALIRHGYEVGRDALRRSGREGTSGSVWRWHEWINVPKLQDKRGGLDLTSSKIRRLHIWSWTDWASYAHACLLGAYLLMVCLVITWLQARSVRVPDDVTLTSTGVTVTSPGKVTHSFQVSATGGDRSPWIDTGFPVKEGDEVSFQASGRVCIAYNRMIQAATSDPHELPPVPWNGPKGVIDWKPIREKDEVRREMFLVKNAPPGLLLATISSTLPSPRPANIIQVGTEKDYSHRGPEGTIWFTINDTWLDDSDQSRLVFFGMRAETLEKQPRERLDKLGKAWDEIKKNKYYHVFYDDNGGAFLVRVEIHPRSKQ